MMVLVSKEALSNCECTEQGLFLFNDQQLKPHAPPRGLMNGYYTNPEQDTLFHISDEELAKALAQAFQGTILH